MRFPVHRERTGKADVSKFWMGSLKAARHNAGGGFELIVDDPVRAEMHHRVGEMIQIETGQRRHGAKHIPNVTK